MPIIMLTALAISDLIATLRKSVDASEIRRNVRFSRQVGRMWNENGVNVTIKHKPDQDELIFNFHERSQKDIT